MGWGGRRAEGDYGLTTPAGGSACRKLAKVSENHYQQTNVGTSHLIFFFFFFGDERHRRLDVRAHGWRESENPSPPPPKIPEKQIAGTYVAARVEKRSSADVKMISDLRYEA